MNSSFFSTAVRAFAMILWMEILSGFVLYELGYKEVQRLFDKHLWALFGCAIVASLLFSGIWEHFSIRASVDGVELSADDEDKLPSDQDDHGELG